MSLGKLLRAARNKNMVKDWCPKPVIRPIPERFWGNKWQNVNSGCMHKYECSSFSVIGFHTNKKQVEGLPSLKCLAYGETPEQAYDKWCEIFTAWNRKEDWVRSSG